jgi:ubiquinone/menaquinone biosynthesis C-methylase UbiE
MSTMILDLGCGAGDSWRKFGISEESSLIGVDINDSALELARQKYSARGWRYLHARGEDLPLPDSSVSSVVCSVALPYMHIPQALSEIHRVLNSGGIFRATLHSPRFTCSEFRQAFPSPKALLFRTFVLLNGLLVLHFTGKVLTLAGKSECCQTERGMEKALQQAGLSEIKFRHEGVRFFVEAKKP